MGKYFGTDGIRGTVGQWPMVPEFGLRLGQAAGEVIRGEQREATVLVGRDTRQSGAMLQQALTAGLMASGVHVIDLGVLPTPGVSWLVRQLKADAKVKATTEAAAAAATATPSGAAQPPAGSTP